MAGSNVKAAKKLLADSGLAIISAETFEEASLKAVECLKGEQSRQAAS